MLEVLKDTVTGRDLNVGYHCVLEEQCSNLAQRLASLTKFTFLTQLHKTGT
jgi:hypothetical protein